MSTWENGKGGCIVPILVGIAGFLFLGPFGLFIGPLAAMLFSKPRGRGGIGGFRSLNATQDAIIALVAATVQADGRIMRSELDYVRLLFQRMFGAELAQVALLRLRDLLNSNVDIYTACRVIRMTVADSRRADLVRVLMELAFVDGVASESERTLIQRIAVLLGVTMGGEQEQQGRQRAKVYTAPPVNYYAVLGISPSAADEEVKRAYRQLAIKWHPDRMGDKSEKERERANEMLQRINEAYEKIKKSRGMK